jgi:hypothetical protein
METEALAIGSGRAHLFTGLALPSDRGVMFRCVAVVSFRLNLEVGFESVFPLFRQGLDRLERIGVIGHPIPPPFVRRRIPRSLTDHVALARSFPPPGGERWLQ